MDRKDKKLWDDKGEVGSAYREGFRHGQLEIIDEVFPELESRRTWIAVLCVIIAIMVVIIAIFSVKIKSEARDLDELIFEAAGEYCLDPEWIKIIVDHESSRQWEAQNGSHIGLMQISKVYHKGRAEKLGIEDMWDPLSNLRIGCDILYELSCKYEDPILVLMCYNEGEGNAVPRYNRGVRSGYAKGIMREYYERINL